MICRAEPFIECWTLCIKIPVTVSDGVAMAGKDYRKLTKSLMLIFDNSLSKRFVTAGYEHTCICSFQARIHVAIYSLGLRHLQGVLILSWSHCMAHALLATLTKK